MSNPKIMKLLGVVLGFEVGDENDLNSKMETDNTASSTTKKETSTSKPTTTTTNEQNPVINLNYSSFSFDFLG
jgi:hypothetical protein